MFSDCLTCDLAFSLANKCVLDSLLDRSCASHHLGYGDGSSIDGILVSDTLQMGELKAFNFALLAAR